MTSVELLTLKQIVYYFAHQGATVGSGDAGKEGEEGFVDLGAIGFLGHDQIRQELDDGDKHSNYYDPAPGTTWTQRSQKQAGSQNK